MHRLFVMTILTALAIPTSVGAQGSGVQWTLDRDATMISKDVGNERWAITYDLATGRATGNVFKTDGPTSFIDCHQVSISDFVGTFECWGADACTGTPCTQDTYTANLGQVPVPMSFFFPPGDPRGGDDTSPEPEPTPTPVPQPPPGPDLNPLLGGWRFIHSLDPPPNWPDPVPEWDIGICLEEVVTVNGSRVVTGFNRRGNTLWATTAGPANDFFTANFPAYEFGVLAKDSLSCNFFVFNLNDQGEMEGRFIDLDKNRGECVFSASALRGPMVGVKANAQNTPCGHVAGDRRVD